MTFRAAYERQPNQLSGPRHIYFDATFTLDGPDRDLLPSVIPGQAWAERARKEILGEMHAPTVQNLMVRLTRAFFSRLFR